MKLKQTLNPLALLTATATMMADPSSQSFVQAQENPFQLEEVGKPGAPDTDLEGNCGEGMCGEGKRGEMTCGEGVCGNMTLDMGGMVMNENRDNLPLDCAEISQDVTISVSAGRKYAEPFPDRTFSFDQHQWQVEPCARITVTYTNEDDVRHQWMVHGLPSYLYPQGMFHLEANGGHSKTGTFIVPSDDKTYLVHCDMAAHMEKGMKAQLVVGNGSGDMPSVPGITGARNPNRYGRENGILNWLFGIAIGILSFAVPVKYLSRKQDSS
ncbi:MAG: hypothetical protein OXN26_09040 [Gammaproteobacteria bacterium]|nr:hypothetical protein [Gammaproteobacteria bacterium]